MARTTPSVPSERATQETAAHEAFLAQALDHSGSAIVVTDAGFRITYANAGFLRLLDHEPGQVLGRHLIELMCGARTDRYTIESMHENALTGRELRTQVLLYTRTGRTLWVSAMMNPVRGPSGALERIVAVLTDITHTRMPEVLQHKVLDAMVHHVPLHDVAMLLCREVERIAPEVTAALMGVDADARLRVLAAPSLPPQIAQVLEGRPIDPPTGGCSAAAATHKPVLSTDIAADPLWASVQEAFTSHGLRACWTFPVQARDGAVLGILAFYYSQPRSPDALHKRLADTGLHLCAPLLEHERERAHIHQLAYYDALTGLVNRSMLLAQTERMLRDAQRNDTPLALMFIDLDRFKQVNDTLGHSAGDALLRAVATRLQDGARAGDVAARMGGDEFVLVLPRCSASQAAVAAKRLLASVNQPLDVEGSELRPNASVGIAMCPEDGADADALMRCADMAMYQAKTDGGQRYHFYRAEMNSQAQERLLLEADLRQALVKGGLSLHYQPQMRGAALHSVEALLRWTHPRLGPISPTRLVKTARECDLLDALTQWVLLQVCRQMADWRARSVAVPHVSVNFQASSFLDPALPGRITAMLAEHGLRPRDMTVEITETLLFTPNSAVLTTARAVSECGITLSLDDFGAGHANLEALHRLPISELKIDRSFVQELETNATIRALTASVLHIARELNLTVVAEGVETQAQKDFLDKHGCAVFQGYLLARPLSAQALEAWLQAQSSASAPVAA